ncbi:MAG: hypothetical protein ACYDHC_01985 [Desulfuromonadaceae bacterium]
MDADARREKRKKEQIKILVYPLKGCVLLGVHPPFSAVKKPLNHGTADARRRTPIKAEERTDKDSDLPLKRLCFSRRLIKV